MSSSVPSSGGVQITRCPVLFNGTNYRDWVPRLRWHMRGLRLWEFLTGHIPCPPPPSVPVRPIISDKATDAEKTKLLDEYDASMESYASQFAAYRTWLDEDARAGAVLAASMEEHLSADIVGFDHAHQMWAFLRERYEPTGQCTYIAALRQEQLLCQGDSTVDDFYTQMSAVWRQLDSIGPPLSPSTCDSCKAQKVALETRRTHYFLTRLRDEFEQLRAQLVSRVPCVSLMEALAAVCNEELRLQNAGLLQSSSSSSSVLAARSSSSPAVAPPPQAPLPAASSSEGGGGGRLHCNYCGKKTHVVRLQINTPQQN